MADDSLTPTVFDRFNNILAILKTDQESIQLQKEWLNEREESNTQLASEVKEMFKSFVPPQISCGIKDDHVWFRFRPNLIRSDQVYEWKTMSGLNYKVFQDLVVNELLHADHFLSATTSVDNQSISLKVDVNLLKDYAQDSVKAAKVELWLEAAIKDVEKTFEKLGFLPAEVARPN